MRVSNIMEVVEPLQLLEELQRELREKNQQLKLINQIGSLLISDLDLEKVVQNVTDIATKVSKAQFGALFYTKEQGKEDYQLFALSGASKEDFHHLPKLRTTPLLASTFIDKEVVRSADITQDSRYGLKHPHRGIPEGHLPIRSYMALPVVSKSGQVLGALFFGHSEAGIFTQKEEDIVHSIAAQAAIAIDSAHLHELKLQKEQQKSLRQISNVLESITDGFFALDRNSNVTYWNKEAEQVTKVKREAILGQNLWTVFDRSQHSGLESAIEVAMVKGQPLHFDKYFPSLQLWLNVNTYPSENGVSVYLRDITKQHRADELEHLEKRVLEMSTKPDCTLEEMIDYYLVELENILPGRRCAVCKAYEKKLYHLAAPKLPVSYVNSINGLDIAPLNGSCGSSGYSKVKVIVSNIAEDIRWSKLRSIAFAADLKACWSVPLLGSNQKLLGTFAIYFNEERSPTPEEDVWMEKAARLLQMILENKLNQIALHESNERYHLATAATNDAIWDLNLVTGKMYKGPGYVRIFGYKDGEEDFSLDLASERMHPDDVIEVNTTFLQALEDKTVQKWVKEYRYLKKDGEYAYVINQGNIIRDHEGNAIRIVGAIQDITERKKFEVEREMLILELKQNNEDLKQFSYITSHKLRAPLSNLLAVNQMLQSKAIEDESSKLLVENFKDSTDKLNDTLNDLLDILVIKNNKGLKKENISLAGSWQEVLKACQQELIDSKGAFTIDFSDAEYVWSNPCYLHSILQNLFTNAIKFRSPNRPLQIELTSKVNDKYVELYFKDNGLGIDLERYQDRLFGLYQRFHYHDNSKGLGLYITQSQIKAMGGNITVESEVDKGTTFIIQFKQQ